MDSTDFDHDFALALEQQLMENDEDCKPQNLTEVPARENHNFLGNGVDLRSTGNCEETQATYDTQDVMLDIVTYTKVKERISAKAEDPDATEYSSSFADTDSDIERYSGLSEAEVESQFFGDSEASPYDAFGSLFQTRKKKLTNHWRNFIRPLMWRCKWTELKIKQIESQALKYARELEALEQGKHSGVHQSCENFCSKSLPFSNQCYRRKAKKRRKRKRVEDTTDPTSYMLHHSLFSYLENKRLNPDGNSLIDNFGNTGRYRLFLLCRMPSCLLLPYSHGSIEGQRADCTDKSGLDDDQFYGFGDADNALEQILKKIELVQARVQTLKNQVDIVISTNCAKFSSSENLSLLAFCDAQTSSAHSPTVSAGNGETISAGAIYTATQQIGGYDIGDLVLPDTTTSSYGEAIHVPDIIESTVGLLSAADVTFLRPKVGDSSEDILDNVLIHNEATDGDRHNSVDTNVELLDKDHKLVKVEQGESCNPSPMPTSEPEPLGKTSELQGQSTLKSCLASDFQFPRNKRKRAERKAGSGGWNKKCSGEPDSQ
ncbi:hypothetical protein Tsubulata_018922 [Turnera subulata]|uniref:Uncharacterized protein n=1 Tax=Turnera subulata TaxID=218843 RepID=A0A9Q0JDT1_9ROSI|nr:hypothetical protein Tsubulata_018922 [Turnera subulata]